MIEESKFLKFVDITKANAKTKFFMVKSIQGNHSLGMIKWHGAWRKYTFQPLSATIFDVDCLKDIIKFTAHLMTERKLTKQNARESKK